MCDKAVDTHPTILKFVPDCYKTQEICDKAVNRWFFLYVILFLIGMKLEKCVTELLLKILFDSILP